MSNNLEEILNKRIITTPNRFCYGIFRLATKWLNLKYRPEYYYHFDKKEVEGKQVVLIGDHAGFSSFYYMLGGYPFARINAVTGYHQVFRKFLFTLLLKSGVIPKRHFSKDVSTVRWILKLAKQGNSIGIFPEGLYSISGSNHPINPGTLSLIKKLELPVILFKSYGLQCSHPSFKDRSVRGKQEYHYEILYTPEELRTKTEDELYDKLLERFRYNDFAWAIREKNAYDWKGRQAEGVEQLIYRCPRCGSEFTITSHMDMIRCTACGNTIRMSECYELSPAGAEDVCPYQNTDEWFKDQRRNVIKEIADPDFSVTYECEMIDLHMDKTRFRPYYVCGEGTTTINHEAISYKGTYKGENVELSFDIAKIPCFKFEENCRNVFYYDKQYYSMKPRDGRAVKYLMIGEELHNQIDPIWNKVCRDAYGGL